jgi:hypothetical protein
MTLKNLSTRKKMRVGEEKARVRFRLGLDDGA